MTSWHNQSEAAHQSSSVTSDTSATLSDRFFRALFEQAPVGMAIADLDHRLLRVNQTCCDFLGYSAAELQFRSIEEITHPDDRAADWTQIQHIQSGEPVVAIEKRYLHRNGSVIWANTTPSPIYDASGALQHYAIVMQISHQQVALCEQTAGLQDEENCQITEIEQGFWIEDVTGKHTELEIRRSRDLFEAVFQESADAIFLVDPDTLINLDCNQRAVELFEADSKNDLIGMRGYTLHKTPFPVEEIAAAQQEVRVEGVWSQEIEYRTLKGNCFWGNIAGKRIEVVGQRKTLVRITDISSRKQAEQTLKQQADRESLLKQVAFQTRESLNLDYILRTTVERTLDFLQADRVVIYQLQPDGSGNIVIEAVSQPEFSILGRHIEAPCFQLEAEQYQQGFANAIDHIQAETIAACHAELLTQFQVQASLAVPIFQDDQLWGLLVTHQCTAPRQWQSFELELLKQLANQVSIAIRQTSLYAQLAMELSERHRVEQTLEQQVQREQLIRAISQQIRGSLQLEEILAASVTHVRQMLRADRALVFRLNPDGAGKVIKESVLPDYPTTAEMMLSDQHFPPESYQFYLQGQARAVNNVETDILAPCLLEFMHQICVKSKLVAPIMQTAETGVLIVWGLLIVHSCARNRIWESAEVALVQQVAVQMGIAIQQADLYFQLETQLQQKEILLKEVHHRVKNNLQVVSAMLNLQARATQDSAVRAVLEDSRSRLRAIALIHEILYQSDNLERLNFQQYIRRLAGTILSTYSNAQIILVYEMQPVLLNLETAIPCGLLVSELVTNAIKHAFPNGRQGEIRIILKSAKSRGISASAQPASTASTWVKPLTDQYVLVIQDNGVGIPHDLNYKNLKSLGLKIVYDLALQLRGSLELDRATGTRFQLTFSELEYRRRF